MEKDALVLKYLPRLLALEGPSAYDDLNERTARRYAAFIQGSMPLKRESVSGARNAEECLAGLAEMEAFLRKGELTGLWYEAERCLWWFVRGDERYQQGLFLPPTYGHNGSWEVEDIIAAHVIALHDGLKQGIEAAAREGVAPGSLWSLLGIEV